MKILLKGANGRMGQAITKSIESESAKGKAGNPSKITTEAEQASVIIDFSIPQAANEHLKLAGKYGLPILIGTTGLSEETLRNAKEMSIKIPIMIAPNTSIGSNLQRALAKQARLAMPKSDVEIVDIHHSQKVDSPSGTALWLAEGVDEDSALSRREGVRTSANEIGVFGLRGGNTAGEHTVYLFNGDERIEITHRVYSRSVFSEGALRAARFLECASPGWYTMEDVLK